MIFKSLMDIWIAFKQFGYQAMIFALLAALIYSIVIIAVNIYRKIKKKPSLSKINLFFKLMSFVLLAIYVSYAISLTLSGREALSREGINLVPGTTIFTASGIGISGVENILLFIPLGVLCPIIWKYLRNVLAMGGLAFILSLLIELTQLLTQRGYFEIDDIILNTFGALLGYLCFTCVNISILAFKKRTIIDVAKEKKIAPPLGKSYDKFTISNEYLLIIFQLIPVIFMAKTIMGFSSDPGMTSRGFSRPVAYAFAKIMSLFSKPLAESITNINNLESLMVNNNEILDMIEKIIRKIAHITEYGLFAFFVWLLIYSRPYIRRYFAYIAGMLSVFILGIIDEANQLNVTERVGSFKDVCVDLVGAAIALFICYLVSSYVRSFYRKRM